MNRSWLLSGLALVALVPSWQPSIGVAQDLERGFVLGASGGTAFCVRGEDGNNCNYHSPQGSFEVFAGYQLNQYFAVYADFDVGWFSTHWRNPNGYPWATPHDTIYWSAHVKAQGTIPLDRVELSAGIGPGVMESRFDSSEDCTPLTYLNAPTIKFDMTWAVRLAPHWKMFLRTHYILVLYTHLEFSPCWAIGLRQRSGPFDLVGLRIGFEYLLR